MHKFMICLTLATFWPSIDSQCTLKSTLVLLIKGLFEQQQSEKLLLLKVSPASVCLAGCTQCELLSRVTFSSKSTQSAKYPVQSQLSHSVGLLQNIKLAITYLLMNCLKISPLCDKKSSLLPCKTCAQHLCCIWVFSIQSVVKVNIESIRHLNYQVNLKIQTLI